MAGLNAPRGLEPVGRPLRINEYLAISAVYPGDLLIQDSAGGVNYAATSGSEATGAAIGVAATKAAAGARVLVYDHPDQIFDVMASGSDIDVQTDIGLNYSVTCTSPDTTYNMSRHRLKSDSAATTTTLPLRLMEVVQAPNNSLGAQVRCRVLIQNHQLGGGAGSAGV